MSSSCRKRYLTDATISSIPKRTKNWQRSQQQFKKYRQSCNPNSSRIASVSKPTSQGCSQTANSPIVIPYDGERACNSLYSENDDTSASSPCSFKNSNTDGNQHSSNELNEIDSQLTVSDSDQTSDCDKNSNPDQGQICEDENVPQINEKSDCVVNTVMDGQLLDLQEEQIHLLVIAYVVRHRVSGVALDDLLKLIDILIPGKLPHSKFLMNKYLQKNCNLMEKHHLCPNCKCYFGDVQNSNEHMCENPLCKKAFNPIQNEKNGNFFFYIPMENQISKLLESNVHHLCSSSASDHIRDVHDGVEMKKIKFLQKKSVFTATWNCDGANLFKSSTYSVWPIQCVINELPFSTRRQNVIVSALWFGDRRPVMDQYLKPFIAEAKKLANSGFHWKNLKTDSVEHSYIYFVICSSDAIARPILKNSTQFNGAYGCDWCLHPGHVVKKGDGVIRAYSFNLPEPEIRTKVMWECDTLQAAEISEPVHGVKSPSMLLMLPIFNIVSSFVPDYLHSVLLGVVKQYLKMWFLSRHHGNDWCLSQKGEKLMDKHLLMLKPPDEISRSPRSITTKSLWKGSEFKAFLLYYSVLILPKLLPRTYVKHWHLLVYSIHALLQHKIEIKTLEKVHLALVKFVMQTEELYGQCFVSFNIHQLTHLVQSVKSWGPLWATSTFMFENSIGQIKKMFHGTQHVPLQIAKMVVLLRDIPVLKQKVLSSAPAHVRRLICQLLKDKSQPQSCSNATCFGVFFLLGKPAVNLLSVSLTASMVRHLKIPVNKYSGYFYDRMVMGNVRFSTECYSENKKKFNAAVLLKTSIFAIITEIVQCKLLCNCIDEHCCCPNSVVVFGKKVIECDGGFNHIRDSEISITSKGWFLWEKIIGNHCFSTIRY